MRKRTTMTRRLLYASISFSLMLLFSPAAVAQTAHPKPKAPMADLAAVWVEPKESASRVVVDADQLSVILQLSSRYRKECWDDSLPQTVTRVDWNASEKFHKHGGQDYVLISKEDTVGWSHRGHTLEGFIEFLKKQK